MTPETLFAQWREANKTATEAERQLFEASLASLTGRGPRPTEDEYERCKALRVNARRLFEAALQQVDLTGRAAGRMPPQPGADASR